MAGRTGLEPATSDVTGRRSNQLNYRPRELQEKTVRLIPFSVTLSGVVGGTGIEPVTPAL